MNYATDLVPAGNGTDRSSGTIQRSVIYLTVVAIAMIAVGSAALAALAA